MVNAGEPLLLAYPAGPLRAPARRSARAARRRAGAAPAARDRRRVRAGAPPRDGALGLRGRRGGLRSGGLRALDRQPGAAVPGRGLGALGDRRLSGRGAPADTAGGWPPSRCSPRCRPARWVRRSCSRPRSSASSSWTSPPRCVTAGGCASRAAASSPCSSPRPRSWGRGRSSRARPASRGFDRAQVLAFSLHPVVLGEIVLPKLLGEPARLLRRRLLGARVLPGGLPLPAVALRRACRRCCSRCARAGGVGCGGWPPPVLLLSLGAHGPLGLAAGVDPLPFRGPQKLFFLTHVAIALLAGLRPRVAALRGAAPAGGRSGSSCPAWRCSARSRAAGGPLGLSARRSAPPVPPLADPRGLVAARDLWPSRGCPPARSPWRRGWPCGRGGAWRAWPAASSSSTC